MNQTEIEKAARILASKVMECVREAGGLDGPELYEWAEEAGLILWEPYDREKHGDLAVCEDEDVWTLTSLGEALVEEPPLAPTPAMRGEEPNHG